MCKLHIFKAIQTFLKVDCAGAEILTGKTDFQRGKQIEWTKIAAIFFQRAETFFFFLPGWW